jgi:hypothetical protein
MIATRTPAAGRAGEGDGGPVSGRGPAAAVRSAARSARCRPARAPWTPGARGQADAAEPRTKISASRASPVQSSLPPGWTATHFAHAPLADREPLGARVLDEAAHPVGRELHDQGTLEEHREDLAAHPQARHLAEPRPPLHVGVAEQGVGERVEGGLGGRHRRRLGDTRAGA